MSKTDPTLTVDYMPTVHEYSICHVPITEVEKEEPAEFAASLNSVGQDGLLLVSMYLNPGKPGFYTLIFAKTGILRESFPMPSNLTPISGGLVGPGGQKLC